MDRKVEGKREGPIPSENGILVSEMGEAVFRGEMEDFALGILSSTFRATQGCESEPSMAFREGLLTRDTGSSA